MSFEQYFQLEGVDEREKMVRFLIGLAPAVLQRRYVADPTYVDFANRTVAVRD